MRCLAWQGLVLVALLLVLPSACGQRRNTGDVRRYKARKAIVRCCGKIRCLDVIAKKRIFSLGASNSTNSNKIPSTLTTQRAASSISVAENLAPTSFEPTAAALLDPSVQTTAVETALATEIVAQEKMIEKTPSGSVEVSASTVATTIMPAAGETSMAVQTTTSTPTMTTTTTSTTTTTTVIPKICPSPSCEIHKQSNLLPLLNFSSVPPGKMHFHAGSFYYSSKINLSLLEAVRSCMALNMTLLTVDLQNMPFYYNLLTDLSLKSAWTSGSSEGTDCDVGRTFAWCSTGKLFAPSDVNSSVIWEKVPDGSPSAARCLVLSVLDRAALTQADCVNDRKPFVCQVTWEQNLQKCCSLGMQPVVHATLTEQQCVADFTKGNWSGNYNYWTGGSQGCKGQWGNCAGATFARLSTDLIWASDQNTSFPHKENCLHLRVNNKKGGNATVVSARACSDKYIHACQSKPTLAPCSQSKCPKTCNKNKTRFSAATGDALKPFSYGDWYTTCGRSLFFPFHKTTWQEAWDFCCAYDMKLLSIEKSLTLGCITKLSIRYPSTSGDDLWTSGISSCQNKYGWCGKKLNPDLTEVNWAQGQPNPSAGDCVFAQFSNSSVNESVLALGNCSQKLNFVCERAKGTTEADIQQYECMSLYNVTDVEIDVFNGEKFNASHFPTKMKCFLKCIGDLTGLLSSGKLVMTIEMLRVIEEISANSTQLQQNFAIVDECGTSSEESECAKAAAIYQCGREKAPMVTNAIQFGLSNKSALTGTLDNDIVPSVPVDGRYCRMQSFPCETNTTLRNTLTSKGLTPYGTTITTAQGKKYFKSSNFAANTKTMSDCHKICCIHGLRLAEFYSVGEADGVHQAHFINDPTDAIIEEVWVNGQQKDVWCRSQRPITDLNLYIDSIRDTKWNRPSCYYLYYAKLAVKYSEADCGAYGKAKKTACCLCM